MIKKSKKEKAAPKKLAVEKEKKAPCVRKAQKEKSPKPPVKAVKAVKKTVKEVVSAPVKPKVSRKKEKAPLAAPEVQKIHEQPPFIQQEKPKVIPVVHEELKKPHPHPAPSRVAKGEFHKKPEIKKHETVAEPVKEEKPVVSAPEIQLKEVEIDFPVTVKDLAIKIQEKPSVLIKSLLDMKILAGINQSLDEKTAMDIARKFGFQIKKAPGQEEIILSVHQEEEDPKLLKPRPPIVTFMGHVDHGKTSLLDAIRKTKVAESEHGGITQHIGAYRVMLPEGEIAFLDTPGHEAFTAMRARGAKATDIVVLVVAADEGIMPQTQEAIDHAKAAGVTIIVALNKVDKPGADVDKIKKQLSGVGLSPEDWGGKTITVPVSAKTGQGIDTLLEMILLEAQMLELKANPQRLAKGVVIEAKMTKGKGPVSTLLVQNGTLHLNENIIVGKLFGKTRAMFDDHGRAVTKAGPSFPVEILGISGVPQAGEQFFVVSDEKQAKELALLRQEKEKQEQLRDVKRISLEDLHAQIQAGKIKDLKLIIKADVQGSIEAIRDTLNKLNVSEIKLDIIHEGVGNINTSDIILAIASNALVVGFNVVADDLSKELISKEGIEVRTYNIIYELANDIKAAVEGMLEPKLKKVFLGKVDVRKVFRLSRSGLVAGCFVTKGKINRQAVINLVRNGELVAELKIASLKRFKDDVREVAEGYECGITLSNFEDVKEGDVIEAYTIEKIARKLE